MHAGCLLGLQEHILSLLGPRPWVTLANITSYLFTISCFNSCEFKKHPQPLTKNCLSMHGVKFLN
jgi:hypothetical protein